MQLVAGTTPPITPRHCMSNGWFKFGSSASQPWMGLLVHSILTLLALYTELYTKLSNNKGCNKILMTF